MEEVFVSDIFVNGIKTTHRNRLMKSRNFLCSVFFFVMFTANGKGVKKKKEKKAKKKFFVFFSFIDSFLNFFLEKFYSINFFSV